MILKFMKIIIYTNKNPLQTEFRNSVRKGFVYHQIYVKCLHQGIKIPLRCVALHRVSKIQFFIEFCKFFIVNLQQI